MKLTHLILAAAVGAVVAVGALYVMGGVSKNTAVKESAYDRVMRTGTLKCGYLLYPKVIERDLTTGKLSGMYIDIAEEMGKQLSLKIDWAAEIGFADAFDGLKTGRYDAMCFPFNQTPGRARETEFTVPILLSPTFAYARADDARFDNDYSKINDPSVKVAFMEGEASQTIRTEVFPKTQPVSLPSGLNDMSQVFLQVTTGKADVALDAPTTVEEFMLKNPDKLKRVPGPPIRMQTVGMDVGIGEESLKSLLSTTLQMLQNTGFIERTVNKYVTGPDQLYFPASPWGASAQPVQKGQP